MCISNRKSNIVPCLEAGYQRGGLIPPIIVDDRCVVEARAVKRVDLENLAIGSWNEAAEIK